MLRLFRCARVPQIHGFFRTFLIDFFPLQNSERRRGRVPPIPVLQLWHPIFVHLDFAPFIPPQALRNDNKEMPIRGGVF